MDQPYDLGSTMHYGSKAFSNDARRHIHYKYLCLKLL